MQARLGHQGTYGVAGWTEERWPVPGSGSTPGGATPTT